MGLIVSKILATIGSYYATAPAKVICIGLDAAGKTTLLYKLKLNEVVTSIPTIGFNVETVTPVKGLTLTMWDLGGQEKIRALWKHYVDNCDAVIFMVDSADKERFQEAKSELFRMLDFDALKNCPILVYCNKSDLPTAVPCDKVAQAMGLTNLGHRVWHCQSSNCLTGEGIYEGMEKLQCMIRDYRTKFNHHR